MSDWELVHVAEQRNRKLSLVIIVFVEVCLFYLLSRKTRFIPLDHGEMMEWVSLRSELRLNCGNCSCFMSCVRDF